MIDSLYQDIQNRVLPNEAFHFPLHFNIYDAIIRMLLEIDDKMDKIKTIIETSLNNGIELNYVESFNTAYCKAYKENDT
jgi:hypothetical protein